MCVDQSRENERWQRMETSRIALLRAYTCHPRDSTRGNRLGAALALIQEALDLHKAACLPQTIHYAQPGQRTPHTLCEMSITVPVNELDTYPPPLWSHSPSSVNCEECLDKLKRRRVVSPY